MICGENAPMRIPDNHPNSSLEKYLLGVDSPKKTKSAQGIASDAGALSSSDQVQSDSVQISSAGQEVARLHQHVESAPDLSAAKVSEIQKQVSDGTYTVDPKEVAKKLVKETILNQLL
jgi:flagellar biosynthesis anti-sigma factor FlgM